MFRSVTAALASIALAMAMFAPETSVAAQAAASPFVGSWIVEQVPPAGGQHSQGTLILTQSGNDLTGVLRLNGALLPVSDVDDTGGVLSFTVMLPGNVTLHYIGALMNDELGLASEDEGRGSYTLTAHRAGAAASTPGQATAPRAAAPPPQAQLTGPTGPGVPRPGGDFINRLLNQNPATAAPPAPPSTTRPPPGARVATAPPPAAATPAARPPAPPAQAPQLEGSWSAEQTRPGSATPDSATLIFTRNGRSVAGVMRSGSDEMPLFDVTQSGSKVSFTLVVPGTPYVTVRYVGTLEGNRMQLASMDDGQGVFRLDARREGVSAVVPAPVEPVEPAAPPRAVVTVAVPPVASPVPPPPAPVIQAAQVTPAVALQGSWNARQTASGSAAPVDATLTFDGAQGSMRVGVDEWPLYDVKQTGEDVTFTLVIPGTPYVTIHYSGTLAGNALKLASLDEGQAKFTLDAQRAGTTAEVAAATKAALPQAPPPTVQAVPPAPQLASVTPPPALPTSPAVQAPPLAPRLTLLAPPAPPQAAPVPAPPQIATVMPAPIPQVQAPAPQLASVSPPAPPPAPQRLVPKEPSPASALPIPASAAAPSAALSKTALPALRDLPRNVLVKTPLMGWASRQKLGTRMTDQQIRDAADGLVTSGLSAAGYVYVEIDDGWQGMRDTDGVLHPNERFPDMKALGDYLHTKGLKFGLATSAAPKSCDGFEGSYGHEATDAKAFAEWGVDYLVYDWCTNEALHTTQSEVQAVYQKMGEALRESGRDIVFAINAIGSFDAAEWGAKTGANLWRLGRDLDENWQSVAEAGFGQNGKSPSAPGAWNDIGLLQTGNIGMSADENRMQLNLWAVLAAPLMLGNDVRNLPRETSVLLANRDLIAVNQDALGRQGKRVAQAGDTEVWAKPLADGSVAVAFFNKGNQSAPIAVSWEQLGLEGPRQVRDLWWHESVGRANNNYVVFLTAHTSLFLKFSK